MTNSIRLAFCALFLLFAPLAAPQVAMVQAQESVAIPDYLAWEKVANQAEISLTRKRASSVALEGLRENLVTWRSRFLAATDQNGARIKTVENQISALGSPPEDAQSESENVAARRVALALELNNLTAPRRVAEEAHSRADGLIRETDNIIRSRTTARLFENRGSPLAPGGWPAAYGSLLETASQVGRESKVAFETNRKQFLSLRDLPTTVFFFLLAAVLLVRSGGWMVRLTGFVQGEQGDARSGFRGFLVSLGQFVLPVFGVVALNESLSASGLLGFRGQIIADTLIAIGMAFFIARWLVLRLLPLARKRHGFLQIADQNASQIRRYSMVLAIVWGLNRLLSELGIFEDYSPTTLSILQFPLVVVCGFCLVRLGQALRTSVLNSADEKSSATADPTEEWSFRSSSVGLFGLVLIIIGIAGPVAMALGFVSAGTWAVFSTTLTLGVLALIIVLAGVLRDVYALISRKDDETARQSLVPVLVSFGLFILSLPVLALIWGARYSDLTEMWTRFQQGVSLGDVRISPGAFLAFAIVFAIGYLATRLLQSTLRTTVLPKTNIDSGGQSAIVSGSVMLVSFWRR